MKTHLTLVIFSLFSIFMVTNTCQASRQEEETREFVLVKTKQKGSKIYRDEKSFSDYITVKNVAFASAAIIITGATCGAGTGAAAQLMGATAAPTIGVSATTGAAIGAGSGAGIAVGGGMTLAFAKWWYGF